MGDLESWVHGQPFHKVGSRAIKDKIGQMRCCVILGSCPKQMTDDKMPTFDLFLQVLHSAWVWKSERCAPAGEARVGIRERGKRREKGRVLGWS
jgi:hypothetical protein